MSTRWTVVAVGQRLPAWAQTAWDDYAKRFPPAEVRVALHAVKAAPRTGESRDAILAWERTRIEAAIPKGDHVVALDERGVAVDTQALAQQLQRWRDHAPGITFLIGGPDGLDPALRQSANGCLRLSDLTLAHAFVRVLLIEQLYRAWTIQTGHPYHRE
ncbi:23S rRNA (pseudouridine(1915)-N(3))-methyltransferase RlmH [Candidatus Symbiobacter mobilis]|uniref:Ribosomal RNA large subunit methyltransferase H n=1 Tax=Candidatus Symbiobacter mobilis CR TaxID=946483 RepID=U5N664_9BURK|nr:23S rRNA (pseudouridine(1915)-N(3))-methyltransferase RlmH [Candidatus Symbiobacter mobilis]AGX86832.1 hypothetical protein Cenrod_0725 [Candidatus Symbiobacter mobilis CR]